MAAKLIANVTKRLISPPAANTEYAHWVSERELHTHSVMCVDMYVHRNPCKCMCGEFIHERIPKKTKAKEQPVSGK